ncbi:hypothetical protein IWZ03DRAFT_382356 [Phyllosticta citriasiana]|uniref:Uncharacterized protein n=1 Tax=Phyllosticta citriasiana TaxID=595635 RepID=A0ABR1KEP3_9PEZI
MAAETELHRRPLPVPLSLSLSLSLSFLVAHSLATIPSRTPGAPPPPVAPLSLFKPRGSGRSPSSSFRSPPLLNSVWWL